MWPDKFTSDCIGDLSGIYCSLEKVMRCVCVGLDQNPR